MINKLNKLAHKFLSEINNDLNKNSMDNNWELKPGNIYVVPVITSLGNYTRADGNSGAFALNPPSLGNISDEIKLPKDREQIVIRRNLAYSYASRIVSEEINIKSALLPLVTEMILTLKKARGYGPDVLNSGVYGTFKRPGKNPDYFRETEGTAGFELRLYSDCIKCIDLEETN